jgi:hypothetical protein
MWQKRLVLSGILLAINVSVQAQWSLVKDKDGIKVYTSDTGTSSIKSVKTVATVKGTCQKLIALFRDIEKQTQWVYAAKQAILIKKVADNELLYYVETALPWPTKNRDAAVRMIIEENPAGDKVKISTIGEPSAIPLKNGKVRVAQFKGIWEAEAREDGNIHIEYRLDLDPGGNLPAGVVNLFVAKGPYESFVNLSRLLAK